MFAATYGEDAIAKSVRRAHAADWLKKNAHRNWVNDQGQGKAVLTHLGVTSADLIRSVAHLGAALEIEPVTVR